MKQSRPILYLLLSVIGLAAPAVAGAQGDRAFDSFVNAAALQKAPPVYPPSEAVRAREGWVLVSFVVSEEGTVIEPMIEDSTGSRAFEQAALDAVRGWRYEPARLNGEPVAQAETSVRIVFQLELDSQGASSRFFSAYQEAAGQLAQNDLRSAGRTIERIGSSQRSNLYEDALYWWIHSLWLEAAEPGKRSEIKSSIYRAIGRQQYFLPPEVLVVAFRRVFVMEAEDGHLGAALRVFEQLGTAEPARGASTFDAIYRELEGYVTRIDSVVAGPDVIAYAAEVRETGNWYSRILRRAFSVSKIDGELESLELRCENGTAKFASVVEDELLAVPQGWIGCSVYVRGKAGTSFSLYEFPDEA